MGLMEKKQQSRNSLEYYDTRRKSKKNQIAKRKEAEDVREIGKEIGLTTQRE